MKRDYKYVLFDWDGTIARTLDVWLQTARKVLADHGVITADEQIIKGFGDWTFAVKLGVKDNHRFIHDLVLQVNDKLRGVKLYNGAVDVLAKLKKRGSKLALVTTSVKSFVLPVLKKYNLNGFFDVVLTAEDVKEQKPNPEIVNKAMEYLDAQIKETLIVGDGPKDMVAGKAAGITTVLFYPAENKRFYSLQETKTFKADHVIHKMAELLTIV